MTQMEVEETDTCVASTKNMSNTIARLRTIRNRYLNSFTMHALNHVINGTPIEKIFWSVKLVAAIGVGFYFCKALFIG